MAISDLFQITLKHPVCINDCGEDAVRTLVNALEVSITDDNFNGFVRTTNGTDVKFVFGSDGNFSGVYAKVNGKQVPLFNGYPNDQLYMFKGPPTNKNPGSGWEVEDDLTVKYLNQPEGNQNAWELFFASRSGIINNI